MKILFLLILGSGLITFNSCGPSAKEQAERRFNDSISHVKWMKTNDSILKAKVLKDSIYFVKRFADFTKRSADFKKTKGYKIMLKHPEWSMDICQRVAEKEVWIGMSLDMLKYERGLPDHVNISNYGTGKEYQWCWDDYTPSCFYGGSDGIVTAYN